MFGLLKKNWPVLFTIILGLLIASKNFSSSTWLSGWDNLHPEFNFTLNVKRSLSGVWLEYQGLGLLGGIAYAADLPRQIILWFFSLFLSLHLLRYSWVFLMLIFGPIGTFFLTKALTKGKNIAATAASSFYLLNLATIQYFYAPFETFTTFFGFLPWFLYLAIKYLEEGGKRNLLILFTVSFLGSASFLVPTLFIVYAVFLGIFLLEKALRDRYSGIRRLIICLFIVIAANSYWLFPASYFAVKNSGRVSLAHQNEISTPDTRYFNENRATAKDVVSLKGFWFDYRDFEKGTFEEVLGNWRKYTTTPSFEIAIYALFITSLIGLLIGIFSKNVALRMAPITLFAVSFVALLTTSFPHWPILNEAFRSVFTKWSVAFSLILSLGIGYFVYFVSQIRKSGKYLAIFILFPLLGLMIFTVRPSFEGSLLYKNLKIQYPNEYRQVFDFFKDKPKEGRIAALPLNTMWGWDFHNWGYRGSGFLWYGIAQPILSRSFDVWSPYNESFYNEASNALYKKDFDILEKILEKYGVKYLLLDESVVNAGGSPELLFIPQIKDFILASKNIHEVAKFGFLTVYETNFGGSFVSAPASFERFDVDSTYSETDTVFYSYGDYLNDTEGTTFPFVNFDKRMGVSVENLGGRILIKSNKLQFSGAKDLIYPDLVFGKNKETPRVLVNEEKKVQVSLPIDQKISADLKDKNGEENFQNCDLKKVGSVEKKITEDGARFLAQDGGVACDFFNFPDLLHSEGYLLHIKGENKEGRSLKIYLQNWTTNRMDLEELLPEGGFDEYFFVLPKEMDKINGYSLNLETRSFGRISSENIVETIEFIPIPLGWLEEIRLEPEGGISVVPNNLTVKSFKKIGTWLYKIETEGKGLLVLGQGYEPGWIAFPAKEFKNRLEHKRVNSWANGWIIPEGEGEIYAVFWPQTLEYLGFFALGLTFLALISIKRRNKF